jgi:predicted nucleotidyltransferase
VDFAGNFKKYPDVKSVLIFGSGARGKYKQGSDIDLAIMNNGVNDKLISKIKSDFQESSLPYAKAICIDKFQ